MWAMSAAGYYFDTLDYTDCLKFDYPGATFPMTFATWDEVADWLRGVVFDDPDLCDRVDDALYHWDASKSLDGGEADA